MRYAILADIHANLTALETVLTDIEGRGGVEGMWCLGDIVGYGPDPRQCIELIQKVCSTCVAGNHDWAAEGKVGTSDFNPEAAAAALWTRRQLQTPEVEYLDSLPLILDRDKFTLVHGSPRGPLWEYIISADTAEANFQYFHTSHCLVSHSHLPLLFELEKGTTVLHKLSDNSPVEIGGKRLIFNPGSVGQPRDNDSRASYGIYDSLAGTFTLHRVPYDIGSVQQRMAEAGLPGWLIERLAYGW